jgi:predicted nucleic acid-binding protein
MGLTKVFLDSNILIYLFEDQGPRGARAMQIASALSARGDYLVLSTFTLAELLVKPLRAGDQVLADRYRRFVRAPGVRMMQFDELAAEVFAKIRQDRGVKPPDAIQLATAAKEGCDLFITNDERLSRVVVPGIRFITSMERAPL